MYKLNDKIYNPLYGLMVVKYKDDDPTKELIAVPIGGGESLPISDVEVDAKITQVVNAYLETHPIEGVTASEVNNLISEYMEEHPISGEDIKGANFIHISFDDVEKCLANLKANNYATIFDEPFFHWLKELHDRYNAKFSLYTYYSAVKDFPNTYKADFLANNDWIKFGLHSNSSSHNLSAMSYAQAKWLWNEFVANIVNMTGSYLSIDRIPRLHYYAGNEDALKGLRDAAYGAIGFLSADTKSNSYYLDSEVNNYLYDNDHVTDNKNGLVFVSTKMRTDWFLPNFTSSETYKAPTKDNMYDELVYRFSNSSYSNALESYIVFGHEWQYYNNDIVSDLGKTLFEDVCRFAVRHGINIDYPQNHFYTATNMDLKAVTTDMIEQIAKSNIQSVDGIVEHTENTFEPLELGDTENSYIQQGDGRIVNNNQSILAIFDVHEGEVYRIKGGRRYQTVLYKVESAQGKPIEIGTRNGDAAEILTIDVTIPIGGTKLYACTYRPTYPTLEVSKLVNTSKKLVVDTEPIIKHVEAYVPTMCGNVLYGKKWAVCGDSFTEGDFNSYIDANGKSGTESDAYDKEKGVWKTYPWWIEQRNGMILQRLAKCGNDFVNTVGSVRPFSDVNTSAYNYTQIDADCDYVTLMFGLNEQSGDGAITADTVGTKDDTDNTTLWGAYNVVLDSIISNNPFVKVGIIISDAWLPKNGTISRTLQAIGKYWCVPVLDLKGDGMPLMIGARDLSENPRVTELRTNAFSLSSTNRHPNVKAHEYRSTVIENFLRSL